MRAILLAFLFAALASASAQNQVGPLPRACGPEDASFRVKLDKSPHSLTPPEPGKARIYFFQDTGVTGINSIATGPTLFGVDGAWVGAIHGAAYFSVSLDPGEHHLCAASGYFYRKPGIAVLGLAHLHTDAGRSYYYRLRLGEFPELERVDSDEGEYVIPGYPLSVSTPKK